jgi:hypothetical protein
MNPWWWWADADPSGRPAATAPPPVHLSKTSAGTM